MNLELYAGHLALVAVLLPLVGAALHRALGMRWVAFTLLTGAAGAAWAIGLDRSPQPLAALPAHALGLHLTLSLDPLGRLGLAALVTLGWLLTWDATARPRVGYAPRGVASVSVATSFFAAAVLVDSLLLTVAAWQVGLLAVGWLESDHDARAAWKATAAERVAGLLVLGACVGVSGNEGPLPALSAVVLIAGLALPALRSRSESTHVTALRTLGAGVVAGVVLLRLAPQLSPNTRTVLLLAGGAGGLAAAWGALLAADLRGVAHQLCLTQLAVLALALGSGALEAGAFHLVGLTCCGSALLLSASGISRARGTGDLTRSIRVDPRSAMWVIFAVAALITIGLPPAPGFLVRRSVQLGPIGPVARVLDALAILAGAMAVIRVARRVRGRVARARARAFSAPALAATQALVLGLLAAPALAWGTGLQLPDPDAPATARVGALIAVLVVGGLASAVGSDERVWGAQRARLAQSLNQLRGAASELGREGLRLARATADLDQRLTVVPAAAATARAGQAADALVPLDRLSGAAWIAEVALLALFAGALLWATAP